MVGRMEELRVANQRVSAKTRLQTDQVAPIDSSIYLEENCFSVLVLLLSNACVLIFS
jgi:hypothetical protein